MSSAKDELMKSPLEPESTKALARMRRLPTRRLTDRIKRESELDEPLNVIAEIGVGTAGED